MAVAGAGDNSSHDDVVMSEVAEAGRLYDRYIELAGLARLPTPAEQLGDESAWAYLPTQAESPTGMLPTTDHPLGVVLPAAG